MFPVTITVHTPQQFDAIAAALAQLAEAEQRPITFKDVFVVKPQPAPLPSEGSWEQAKPTPEPAQVVITPKEELTTAPPTPEPAPVEAVQEKAAEVPPAPVAEATYQDAAKAITSLSKIKGRDAAVKVLAEFGGSNLKEVKPEQYAAVIAAAEKALGA